MRRRRLALLAVAALACPWPTRVAPVWKVQALGPGGEPLPYLLARQQWRDASAMGDRLERTAIVGRDGTVRFPSRWAWANSAERIWRLARLGEYCSLAYAHVYVWDIGYSTGVVRYTWGEPLPGQVHVRVDTSTIRPVLGRANRLARHGGMGAGRHQCRDGS